MIESRPARLTPSPAPPTGAASGVLNGTYPGPGLADGVVTPAKLSGVGPTDVGAAAAIHASRHATGGADPITPVSIGAASLATALQTASDAGQIPVSDGAGTSYPARARLFSGTAVQRDALSALNGDEWYVSSGAGVGTFWKRMNSAWRLVATGTDADAILTLLGGIKTPPSPSTGDVLTWDGSVWGAEPTSALPSSVSYDFSGGAHDYTADPAYVNGGTGSPYAISDLLGDGTAVPRFEAMNTSLLTSLARTTTPSLRIGLATANVAPWLAWDSTSDGAASLLIRPPYWIERAPAWRVTLRVAVNFADMGLSTVGGTDFISGRAGIVERDPASGVTQTVCAVDIFSHYPDNTGELSEAHYVDGTTTYGARIVLTGETSSGLNVRDVRFTVSGSGVKVETATSGGGYTARLHQRTVRRRGARGSLALGLSVGQVKATPVAGYWIEARSLIFEVI